MTKKNTVQAQPATDRWKVPNWRDENMYPKVGQVTLDQWRWEFLRRDAEYRNQWESQRENRHPFHLALEGDPEDFGFDIPYYPENHEDRWEDIWRILRKYGLARLLDPSVPNPKDLRFYFVPFRPDPQDIPELKKANIRNIPWKLQYPYLAWFDIWKPIEPQIEYYRELLKREKGFALDRLDETIGRSGKKKTTWAEADLDAFIASWEPPSKKEKLMKQTVRPPAIRARGPSQEDYPKFLRVLDAHSDKTLEKTRWLTIGKEILKKGMDVYDETQIRSHAKQTYKTAQAMWWKIPIERTLGPVSGMEDDGWKDSHSVLPPLGGEDSLLSNWLNLLPPRMKTILISSLS